MDIFRPSLLGAAHFFSPVIIYLVSAVDFVILFNQHPLTDEVIVHDSKVLLIPNAKSMNPNSDGVDLGQDVAAFPVPKSYGGALFFPSYDPVLENEDLYLVNGHL